MPNSISERLPKHGISGRNSPTASSSSSAMNPNKIVNHEHLQLSERYFDNPDQVVLKEGTKKPLIPSPTRTFAALSEDAVSLNRIAAEKKLEKIQDLTNWILSNALKVYGYQTERLPTPPPPNGFFEKLAHRLNPPASGQTKQIKIEIPTDLTTKSVLECLATDDLGIASQMLSDEDKLAQAAEKAMMARAALERRQASEIESFIRSHSQSSALKAHVSTKHQNMIDFCSQSRNEMDKLKIILNALTQRKLIEPLITQEGQRIQGILNYRLTALGNEVLMQVRGAVK